VFGWLYPLVEFNGTWSTTSFSSDLQQRLGFIDFGRFDNVGSLLTVAPGVNAVIVRDKLELGVSYETPIWSAHNFNYNGVLVKMILRF